MKWKTIMLLDNLLVVANVVIVLGSIAIFLLLFY